MPMYFSFDGDTKVIIQGSLVSTVRYYLKQMKTSGTQVAAGVVPSGPCRHVEGVPVFNSVRKAVIETAAKLSLICSSAENVYAAGNEAIESGVRFIICTTRGVPVHDMVKLLHIIRTKTVCWVGPHSPGLIRVGRSSLSLMPNEIFLEGNVGIISRNNTLLIPIIKQLSHAGLGQSYIIGLGDDLITGSGFEEFLPLLSHDTQTRIILLIDEPYGKDYRAVQYIQNMQKPVIGFVAQSTTYPNEYDILYENKSYIRNSGIPLADFIEEIPKMIRAELNHVYSSHLGRA